MSQNEIWGQPERMLKVLRALAALQRWEVREIPLMRTLSGRQLYFGIIAQMQQGLEEAIQVESLKELYFGSGMSVSERCVRLKLREFEREGLVCAERNKSDLRSRNLVLDETLKQQMGQHADAAYRLLGEEIVVVG